MNILHFNSILHLFGYGQLVFGFKTSRAFEIRSGRDFFLSFRSIKTFSPQKNMDLLVLLFNRYTILSITQKVVSSFGHSVFGFKTIFNMPLNSFVPIPSG